MNEPMAKCLFLNIRTAFPWDTQNKSCCSDIEGTRIHVRALQRKYLFELSKGPAFPDPNNYLAVPQNV